MFAQGRDHGVGIFAVDFDEHRKARGAFNQCRKVRVTETCNEVTFPVAGKRPVYDLRVRSEMETPSTI
jgi:hypothetical protein